LLAAWFPLIVGEPGVVHACPTHGAPAVASAPVGHAQAAAVDHHHAAPASHQASHDSAPGHGHHNCTCISCCTGNVAPPATPVAVTTVVVASYATQSTRPAALLAPSRAPAFSRQFQTGPPRA